MKKLMVVLVLAVLCTSLLIPAMAETGVPTFATTKSFVEVLEANDLAYTFTGVVSTGDEHIYLDNEDDNFAYTFHVYFHEDSDLANVFIWNIITFEDKDFANVLRVVNELNYTYKYTRFYIDESDNTVTCAMSMILHDENDAGDIVLEGLLRVASILTRAYPPLAVYDK